jgi:hypothetical protein
MSLVVLAVLALQILFSPSVSAVCTATEAFSVPFLPYLSLLNVAKHNH